MRYAKGICWIGDCRIPANWKEERPESWFNSGKSKSGNATYDGNLKTLTGTTCGERLHDEGRFTPNLLVCDDMLNDGVVTQYNKTREDKGNYLGGHRKEYVGTTDNDVVKQIKGQFFNDKGTNSRYYDLDKWFDKIIDEIQ